MTYISCRMKDVIRLTSTIKCKKMCKPIFNVLSLRSLAFGVRYIKRGCETTLRGTRLETNLDIKTVLNDLGFSRGLPELEQFWSLLHSSHQHYFLYTVITAVIGPQYPCQLTGFQQ